MEGPDDHDDVPEDEDLLDEDIPEGENVEPTVEDLENLEDVDLTDEDLLADDPDEDEAEALDE